VKSLNALARACFVLASAAVSLLALQSCIVKGAYDEYCTETRRCPDGGTSDGGGGDGGSCLADNATCTQNSQCCSQSCAQGTCKQPANCGGSNAACGQGQPGCCQGFTCDPQQNKCLGSAAGSCKNDNTNCSSDVECCSGRCQSNLCMPCGTATQSCDSRTDCCYQGNNLRCGSGSCSAPSGFSPDGGGACYTQATYCLPNDNCCNGECTAQACPGFMGPPPCSNAPCSGASDCCSGYWCDLTNPNGSCVISSGQTKGTNIACRHHSECQSGFCDTTQPPGKWRCAAPNPVGCASVGKACGAAQCCGGMQCSAGTSTCCMLPGEPCGSDTDCCSASGGGPSMVCKRGVCQLQIGTIICAPISSATCQKTDGTICKQPGSSCTNAAECCTNMCNGQTCT
jgi:hypothetical protein